jgi:hypothetical protein
MKYALEMASAGMINVPKFHKHRLGFKKLLGGYTYRHTDTHAGSKVISYAYFHFVFQNREKRLKIYFFPT